MFKLLVADDEGMIRRGIITMLGRALACEDVEFMEASNGEQALELCYTRAPDLIISDIRMPGCDGLDFIRRLRANAHSPDVIILSGYEDFSYAKTAISLGVKEYVLKPVKKKEFVDLIAGYVQRIKEDRQRRNAEISQQISVYRTEESLRRNLLLDLMEAEEAAYAKEALAQLGTLGIHLESGLYLCGVMQIRMTGENEDYIGAAVHNIADEALETMGLQDTFHVEKEKGIAVFLYQHQSDEKLRESARNSLSRILILLKQYLNVEVYVGIGDPVYGGECIAQSYRLSRLTLLCKAFGLGGNMGFYHRLPLGKPLEEAGFENLLTAALPEAQSQVIQRFDSIFAEGLTRHSLQALEDSHKQLGRTVHKQMVAMGIAEEYVPPYSLESIWDPLHLRRELAAYVKWAKEKLPSGGTGSSLFAEIVGYVRSNAAGDINLNSVARHFSRSPGYLSTLFKKEAGQTFTELLTQERMKLAKEMLEDTRIPIGEVSALCGYASPKHFSSVFRKHFAVNPAAYRDNHRLDMQMME